MKSAKEKIPGNSELHWFWCKLENMTPVLLYDLLAMRESIFVVEQKCIYQELDGRDKLADHLLVMQNQRVVACLRVLPPGVARGRVRIGRVAVSPGWRKRGLARLMVQNAVSKIRVNHPLHGICLDAQTYLQGFYLSLGFRVCGEEFLEDGIPHVPMQM